MMRAFGMKLMKSLKDLNLADGSVGRLEVNKGERMEANLWLEQLGIGRASCRERV